MPLVEQLIKNKHHLILSCLLVIFIAFDITIPEPLASIIDSIIGKIFVVGGALAIITANKFVGILALIAAYVLIVRSGNASNNLPHDRYLPSEKKKSNKLSDMNVVPYPVTLEEETVQNMMPRTATDTLFDEATFKPVQNDLHGAVKC